MYYDKLNYEPVILSHLKGTKNNRIEFSARPGFLRPSTQKDFHNFSTDVLHHVFRRWLPIPALT